MHSEDEDDSLPDLSPPITENDVLRNREECVARIVAVVLGAIACRRSINVSKSTYDIDPNTLDVRLDFDADGMAAAAAPEKSVAFAKALWMKARTRWSYALVGEDYRKLLIDGGMRTLSKHDFSMAFQQALKDGRGD